MSIEGQQKPEAPKAVSEPEEKSLEGLEKDLSPEVVEQIMAKVEDIEKEGIGYSSLLLGIDKQTQSEKISSILTDGILGTPYETTSRKKWIKQTRQFDPNRSVVHFNIVGRTLFPDKEGNLIKDRPDPLKTEIGNGPYRREVTILFDVSKFDQDNKPQSHLRSLRTNKIHTYRAGRDTDYVKTKYAVKNPKTGQWDVNPEYGFILSPRVSPRLFKGIVLTLKQEKNNEHVNKIREIVAIEKDCYKDNQNMLLPIYHEDGDLLWPKQMSYEEVKKFVEERDKKKEETAY